MPYEDMDYSEFDMVVAEELPLGAWLRPRLESEPFLASGVNAVLIYKHWGDEAHFDRLEVAVNTELDWREACSVVLGVVMGDSSTIHPVPIPVVTPHTLARLINEWRIVNGDGNADRVKWVTETFRLGPDV